MSKLDEMVEAEAERIASAIVDGTPQLRTQAKAQKAALRMARFMRMEQIWRALCEERLERLENKLISLHSDCWIDQQAERKPGLLDRQIAALRTLLEGGV